MAVNALSFNYKIFLPVRLAFSDSGFAAVCTQVLAITTRFQCSTRALAEVNPLSEEANRTDTFILRS